MPRRKFLPAVMVTALLLAVTACMTSVAQKPVTMKEANIRAEAAQYAPPQWKMPLGSSHIDDMAMFSASRLLLTLRKDATEIGGQYAMLVDTATGRPLWRFDARDEKAELRRVLALSDILLYRADGGGEGPTTLIALDPASGSERWTLKLEGRADYVQPLLLDGLVLAIRQGDEGISATAYELSSGRVGWQRKFARPPGKSLSAPLVTAEGMWLFYGGVEKVDTASGRAIWRREDIVAGEGAFPRLVGDSLYVADAGQNLHRLSATSGKGIWKSMAPAGDGARLTNIFPLGANIYLRAVNRTDAKAAKPLVAVRTSDGSVLWRHASEDFIVSNMIENGGRLYFATRSRIEALSAATGSPVFATEITNSGRGFPVQIRRFGNRIVFLGELIVAGVDANSGAKVYSRGFDPVDDFVTLDNVNSTIRNNTMNMGGPDSMFGDFATVAAANAERYQEMSNHYADTASRERSLALQGDGMAGIRARGAQIKAGLNREFSRMESNMAVISVSIALSEAITTAQWNADLAAEVRRQEYLRQAITTLYLDMERGEYAYRPIRDIRSRSEQFAGIAVVHMPTGKVAQTNLSAQHFIYGLWNLIDFDKGLVYHNGVGLDPADFAYDGQTGHFPTDYLNTFLIAQPVNIPH